jgi:glycerol-3-phosphate dehydrogenase
MSQVLRERVAALERLRAGVDVLVIGGGITGAGVALDAALRGYSVVLAEQSDYASGTSSRSTKLLHGGLRYLPQRQFGLVREALRERDGLRRLAPHLVHPLPFVIPIFWGLQRPLGLSIPSRLLPLAPLGVRLGLVGYDLLSRSDLRHRPLRTSDAMRYVPSLRTDGLRAAYLYHDAQADDVRLTHAVLATARFLGASTLNYVQVEKLSREGQRWTAAILDRMVSARHVLRARHVVNAAGIWAEEVARMGGDVPFQIRHSKGTHLVLRRSELLNGAAMVIPETDDKRLAFLVPWRGKVLLGTTDTPFTGSITAPVTTADDARYLLDHLNRYLQVKVSEDDIVGAFAGLRPLVGQGERPADVSRDHQVVEHKGGLVSIIGGKLTTYRKMAQDVVDVLVRRDGRKVRCRTHERVLSGGEDPERSRAALARAVANMGVDEDQTAHLYHTYGNRAQRIVRLMAQERALRRRLLPDFPFVGAEVVYACRDEQALSLGDWLILRTRLGLLDRNHAAGCAREVARLMGLELGWTEADQIQQFETFENALSREMAFLRDLPGRGS